jgi:arginyl-tRNA synthetase
MEISFNPIHSIDRAISLLFKNDAELLQQFKGSFDPVIRVADPKFADFQVNGILSLAKKNRLNPVQLANTVCKKLTDSQTIDSNLFELSVAGPGFINFKLKASYLSKWLESYSSAQAIQQETSQWLNKEITVIDFPSANTAKQAHIGHLRPMVIGESIARILEFSGATVIRDNHIGDWGTNFGSLIMILKKKGITINEFGNPAEALELIDSLYKEATTLENNNPELRDISRNELLKLQNGDSENTLIWQSIIDVSNQAFEKLFEQLSVKIDYTLGESFYKDKVQRIYDELLTLEIAEKSDGALVVWHNEIKKFAKGNKRPFPFNIRKKDGASNYASTDLATILYRIEHFKAQSVIYLTDSRQQDHFEQLFLTTKKWFQKKDYPLPKLKHVWWGTILGSDNKPIKTKSGESIKLQLLIDEAIERALKVVAEKNPSLPAEEQRTIAKAVGIGALKYADLSSNRTQDYVFDWDRMLSFEGNTAPYLLYVIARINSIFRKADLDLSDSSINHHFDVGTTYEIQLARKLIQFPITLNQTLSDLRPHFLSTYLFELAGVFNTFYNNEKVIDADSSIQQRRISLCHRTHTVLSIGLNLLGITTVDRM